jgi:hypothetical protein
MVALLAILVVAFCGLTAAPIWSVPIAELALTTISYGRHYGPTRSPMATSSWRCAPNCQAVR